MAKKVLISKQTGVQFGYCPRMAQCLDYEIHVIDDEPQREADKPRKRKKPKALAAPEKTPAPTLDDLDELLNGLDT